MRVFRLVTLVVFSLVFTMPVFAEEYEEGVHYERLSAPQPTSTKGKVEVLEVFWYGCPHCFRFEPYIERWLKRKPENAEFVRLPGVLRADWEVHARAFYTSQLLGVFDKVHQPLFDALHLQKRKLDTQEALRDFFAEHGVDKIEFTKTFRSFAVETRIRRAKTLASRYGLRGVPAIIVNGKYLVSNRMTGGNANTIKVINFLVKKES